MLHALGIIPVDQPSKSKPRVTRGHYDANYNNFQTKLYEQVRRMPLARTLAVIR
jgi:hypothetical protein